MDPLKHASRWPPNFLLTAIVLLAPSLCQSALVLQPDTVPPSSLTDKVEFQKDASSSYAFDYSVSDPRTGDAKSQWETQLGGVVRGQYALLGPDGNLRSVSYTADDANGFQAIVRYMDPRQPIPDEGLDVGPGPAIHSSEWENQRLEQPLPSGLRILRPGYEQFIGLAHDGASSMYRYQPPLFDSDYKHQSIFLLPKQSSHGFTGFQLLNQQETSNHLHGQRQAGEFQVKPHGGPGHGPTGPSEIPKQTSQLQPSLQSTSIPHSSNLAQPFSNRPQSVQTQDQKPNAKKNGAQSPGNIQPQTSSSTVKATKSTGKVRSGGGDRTSPRGGTGTIGSSTSTIAPGSGSLVRIPNNQLYSETPATLHIPFPGRLHENGGAASTATPTGTEKPAIFAGTTGDPAEVLSSLYFVTTDTPFVRSSSTTPSYSEPPDLHHSVTPKYGDALLNAISELARAPTREPVRAEPESSLYSEHGSSPFSELDLERVPIELVRIPSVQSVRADGELGSTLLRRPANAPQIELEKERVPIELVRIPTRKPQILPTQLPTIEPEAATMATRLETRKRKQTGLENSNSKVVDNLITPGISTEKPPRKSSSKKRASTKRVKSSTTAAPSIKERPSKNKSTNGEVPSKKNLKGTSSSNRNGVSFSKRNTKTKSKKNASDNTVTTARPVTHLPVQYPNQPQQTSSAIHDDQPQSANSVIHSNIHKAENSVIHPKNIHESGNSVIHPNTHESGSSVVHPNIHESGNSVIHTNIHESGNGNSASHINIHELDNSIIHPEKSNSVIQSNTSKTSVPITHIETTTTHYVNATDFLDSSLETQESLQNEYVDKTVFDYTESPGFQVGNLKSAPIATTTQNPSLPRSERYPLSLWHTIPYTTTQSPKVLTSSPYEATTDLLMKDVQAVPTDPSEVTTPFRAHTESHKEPLPSSTTERYTTIKHRPYFPSVFVDNYESDAVTYPPRISTEKDLKFFNLTESSYDAVTEGQRVTTTTSAPVSSRIYPLKMLSPPTEMSMDFSSFNDDGIFDQDVLDPAVALSERVSVSLETTTTERVPGVEVDEKDDEPPSMNGANHYPILISFVSSLVMFLPILYNVAERGI